jgi:myo-inositol 2-dehydrogenase / D-chiro-inositol 1-dehydrogenase
MGLVHLDALRRSAGAEPVAAVDPRAGARDSVTAQGLDAYATVDELLAAGGFDAVLIAAPSDMHVELVTALARAGMPVLCEKPCGLTADDVRTAAQAADDAGTLLQVGYWRRFVPELVALRERIARGELGEITLVMSHQWDEHPPAADFRAHSGGIAVDMGVHEFDQIRWLLGQEFEDVAALPAGPRGDATSAIDPDAAVVTARLSGGSAATVLLSRRFPQPDSCWVEVMGTRGHERCLFMWGAGADRAFVDGMAAQADAFADAVRGGPVRGAGADDAAAALTVAARAADCLEAAVAPC